MTVHQGELSVDDAGLYLGVLGVALLHAFEQGGPFLAVVGQEDGLLDALGE